MSLVQAVIHTGELSAGGYPHMHSLGALAAGKFCPGTLCTLGTPVFSIKHPPGSSVHLSISVSKPAVCP